MTRRASQSPARRPGPRSPLRATCWRCGRRSAATPRRRRAGCSCASSGRPRSSAGPGPDATLANVQLAAGKLAAGQGRGRAAGRPARHLPVAPARRPERSGAGARERAADHRGPAGGARRGLLARPGAVLSHTGRSRPGGRDRRRARSPHARGARRARQPRSRRSCARSRSASTPSAPRRSRPRSSAGARARCARSPRSSPSSTAAASPTAAYCATSRSRRRSRSRRAR